MPVTPEGLTILALPEAAGSRLDAFLASRLTDISRSVIQRAIESGDVTVNDRAVKPSYKVRANDEVQVELPEALPLEALPEPIPLDIVHEDDEVIVINKPAGMVVHPGAGVSSGTLANALVWHFNQLSQSLPQTGGALRPGIVHRLDVGTSGLIVVAKTDRAHLNLAAQFEGRSVNKSYLALVYGNVQPDEGKIDAPIGRDPRNRVKMSVRPAGQGRQALTLYRVIKRFAEFTLLDVTIKTGRTHQIRVHLAHIRHPVVGDSTYDSGRANTVKNPQWRVAIEKLGRPFLHAARLGFIHPVSDERLQFTAPLPNELQNFLEALSSSPGR
ncbi:MAG TPA: RluA family pseudouridine synthase [Blastocatellia bacterium]|nr:RluA family pseudouridine synthase [Blastocatellia bacterium]